MKLNCYENIDFLSYPRFNIAKENLIFNEKLIIMNLAKISTNGQITVSAEIRQLLGLKSGDKILFIRKPNGEIVIPKKQLPIFASPQVIRLII